MTKPVLHQMRFSHFNEKARWALDYKGIPHRRDSVAPGAHVIRSRRLGGSGTLPVLVVDGETTITDSAEIIAELERSHPDPPLYPSDEGERRRALELEAWLGEELGPPIRSAIFADMLPDARTTTRTTLQGLPARTKIVHRAMFPLARIAVRRSLDADDAGGRRGREKTVAALDRIESELRPSGYLAGDGFSVADLTAAAMLGPLVAPEQFQYEWPDPWPERWREFQAEHRGRPAWAYTERIYERHRGDSAEVS